MIQARETLVRDDALAVSVCELAMAMFDVDGALLTLEDGTRLGAAGFAKALPETLVFLRSLPADGEGQVIADASRDRRYFFDPVVLSDPGVRFYADQPLRLDGAHLGVIALVGATPREDFDDRRRDLLARLAALAAGMLSLGREARDRAAFNATLQAALRLQTLRLDQAARTAPFGYWTIDLATRELYWSEGLFDIYGLDADSFTPSLNSHFDLYGDLTDQVLAHIQTAVAAGEDFDFVTAMTRVSDGGVRQLHVRGGIERDAANRPLRLCAVVCDISERTATAPPRDDVLRRFNEELRHPLHDILDMARAMDQQKAAPSADHIAAFSDELRREAEVLDRLTPDVASNPSLVLADALRAALAPFSARAQARDTRLNLHFVDWRHTRGQVDGARLQQVMHALLGHACAVTRGGLISVTASQVQAENAVDGALETRLHVVVRESGSDVGDAHAQAMLAGRDGRNGLSEARALVEAMGGDMGVYAHLDDGMRIWFEVPVQWEQSDAPRPRHLAPDRARPDVLHPSGDRHIHREYLRALLQDMKLGLT